MTYAGTDSERDNTRIENTRHLNYPPEERKNLINTLLQPDKTKPLDIQKGLGLEDAEKIVSWLIDGQFPGLGFTLCDHSNLKEINDTAVLLTIDPQREVFLRPLLKLYQKTSIPLIFMYQSYENRYIHDNLVHSGALDGICYIAHFFDGFGPDISSKREYGSMLAYQSGIRYLIHHDIDVTLFAPIEHYVQECKRIFSFKAAGVVSFPVVNQLKNGIFEVIKPRKSEEINFEPLINARRASFGAGGCFLMHDLNSTAKIWTHGGMMFSWVRGLFSEWGGFLGILRTAGKYGFYPPENSNLVVKNNIDGHNADVLLSDFSVLIAARVLVSCAQTLAEYGLSVSLARKYLERGTLDIDYIPSYLQPFYLQWQEQYIGPVLSKKTPHVSLEEVFKLAQDEFDRRESFIKLQSSAIKAFSEDYSRQIIPPFSPLQAFNN